MSTMGYRSQYRDLLYKYLLLQWCKKVVTYAKKDIVLYRIDPIRWIYSTESENAKKYGILQIKNVLDRHDPSAHAWDENLFKRNILRSVPLGFIRFCFSVFLNQKPNRTRIVPTIPYLLKKELGTTFYIYYKICLFKVIKNRSLKNPMYF